MRVTTTAKTAGDADDDESPLMAQMVTTVMFLSPAIRRVSAGSLVMTEIRSADADWMTAPMCASATETCAACRMLAAALA